MEAFDFDSEDEISNQSVILIEGLDLFESLFGFRSKSFISPCYVWDSRIEPFIKDAGVLYLQGLRQQYLPTGEFDKYNTVNHHIGALNNIGQRYLVRNCVFEPATIPKSDWVGYTLQTIDSAFRWSKPATISTHRINYIGTLDEKNRDKNLALLSELLHIIIKKWPDVEFMTSDQLGDLMNDV